MSTPSTRRIAGVVVAILLIVLVGAIIVSIVRPWQTTYADGTRNGDLVVAGRGWTNLPSGGRLVLLTCQTRVSGGQFERAAPVAVVLDIPPDIDWQ